MNLVPWICWGLYCSFLISRNITIADNIDKIKKSVERSRQRRRDTFDEINRIILTAPN